MRKNARTLIRKQGMVQSGIDPHGDSDSISRKQHALNPRDIRALTREKHGSAPIPLSTAAGPSERVAMATTNATDAYRAARERLDRQIKQIQELLHAHANKQQADSRNWGFAGDLFGHVADVLNDAIEFLGGTKETAT